MTEYRVPERARQVGEYLRRALEAWRRDHEALIVDVRGMGLLLAVQFHDTMAAKVVTACNQEGLLLNPVRPDAIRLMPPLIITEADVDEAMAKLERGLAKALEA